MALWNPWYLYALYLGAFLLFAGATGLWYGVYDHDIVRSAFGIVELTLGLGITGFGTIMRRRYREVEEV